MVSVRVPATIANLGPGFDTFGLAVGLHNVLTVEQADTDRFLISPHSTVETASLRQDPKDNLVFSAMDRLFQAIGQPRPRVNVTMAVHIPIARGLGSSSTAVVGGLLAANRLAGDPLTSGQLLALATEMEGHPDNVAPALAGGAVLCDAGKPYSLPWPDQWRILIAVPPYEVNTGEARKILPANVPLQDAIFNVRKASLLTYALLTADPDALRASLEDRLHQPYRQQLIAEFEPVRRLAAECGAYGTVISGSGSAMAVFHPDDAAALLTRELERFRDDQSPAMRFLSLTVDSDGAKIL